MKPHTIHVDYIGGQYEARFYMRDENRTFRRTSNGSPLDAARALSKVVGLDAYRVCLTRSAAGSVQR